MLAGANGDVGVTQVSSSYSSNPNNTMMALFVRPADVYGAVSADYHWYRRDKDGKWSHKIGTRPATNLDENDQIITDPRYAARANYDLFCGWFVSKTQIRTGTSNDQGQGVADVHGYLPYTVYTGPQCTQATGEVINARSSGRQSSVTVIQFSGRRDVEVPLVEVLDDNIYNQLLSSAHALSYEASGKSRPSKTSVFIPAKLGYQGLLINDREGIFYAKGTQVFISGTSLKQQGGFVRQGISEHSLQSDSLEKDILSKLQSKGFVGRVK